MTDEQRAEKQLSIGRSTLLSALMLTIVNLMLYFLGSDRYILFSAFVPYYLTVVGTELGYAVFNSVWNPYTYTVLGVSAVILLVYLLCWHQSKNRTGWLIAGLVLFALDTLCLVGMKIFVLGSSLDITMDFIIHALVLYYLIIGVIGAKKLKKAEECLWNS